jgi:D-lactate dehydrogenase
MRIAVFSSKPYDRAFLEAANAAHGHGHTFTYFEPRLSRETAALAARHDAVCAFVNDQLSAEVLSMLHTQGIKLVALRCAGFNNVDLVSAEALNIKVVRVPAYSPYAVAEHTAAMILSLNRKIYRAHNRVREMNFSLDGLLGYDIHGRTVGVIGTGQIGQVLVKIMLGFGCRILAHDPYPSEAVKALGVDYVDLPTLYRESDIISLHCPLTPQTRHMIDDAAIDQMKRGVMLINTSRGALLDTPAVVEGLKREQIGYLGMDVYEEEVDVFFEDLSGHVLQDDILARLLTFPNVLMTSHQAFFTRDALQNIAETTLMNISLFARDGSTPNEVTTEKHRR